MLFSCFKVLEPGLWNLWNMYQGEMWLDSILLISDPIEGTAGCFGTSIEIGFIYLGGPTMQMAQIVKNKVASSWQIY